MLESVKQDDVDNIAFRSPHYFIKESSEERTAAITTA